MKAEIMMHFCGCESFCNHRNCAQTPSNIGGFLLKWQVWALTKVHSATALSVKSLVK